MGDVSFLEGVCTYDRYTLPKTNVFAPENGWLEDEIALLGFGLPSKDMLLSQRVHVYETNRFNILFLAAVSKNGSGIQQFALPDHGLTGCLCYWLT